MLIGICGLAGSGKDQFADYLIKNPYLDIKKYSFATPIKEICNDLFGWDDRHAYGDLKEVVNKFTVPVHWQASCILSFRHYFGDLCTISDAEIVYLIRKELFGDLVFPIYEDCLFYLECSPRQIYQRFGTEVVRENVRDSMWLDLAEREYQACKNLIIPDVRFNNEAEWIRQNGGKIYKIERPGIDAVNKHSSEDGIYSKYIDQTIINDSTLDKLEFRAVQLKNKLCL